jgi:hypothetical protein
MTTCTICRRRDPSGAQACAACQADLHGALTELRHQAPLLRASLQPGASPRAGTTTGGRATAPLPARLDVLSLLGPAASGPVDGPRDDQTGPVPITAILRDWAHAVADEQHKPRPAGSIETHALYLRERLGWVCQQHWVVAFAGELQRVLQAVRGITRTEPRTRPLPAPCACGAFGLSLRDWAEHITCAVCGRYLTREQYDQHAAAVLPPLYRLGILMVAADTPPSTTRAGQDQLSA